MDVQRRISNYWVAIKDKRYIGVAAFIAILGQQIAIICSPVSIKLVELTRAHYYRGSQASNDLNVYHQNFYVSAKDRAEQETWFEVLLHFRKLVEYIKQYHCVGNKFFISLTLQLAANFYLFAKATFHKFFTGPDRNLADYYADRYFPRLFHSYSLNQSIDSQMFYCSIFILSFRLSRVFALIRNSIVNRYGYRHITAQQSSYTSSVAFVLPIDDWKRFWHLIYNHRKDCAKDPEARRRHISFAGDTERLMREKSEMEFVNFHNAISFEECYSVLETKCRPENRIAWAKDWYVSEPLMPLDPHEYSWLISLTLIGMPIGIAVVLLMTIVPFAYELCTIAYEKNEESCLMQITVLATSLSRMIRLLDVILLVMSFLPSQIEGSIFYWDCCVLISRVRKVRAALEDDLDRCARFYRSNEFGEGISLKDRQELNRDVRVHIKLLRCTYKEFRDLRWSHTVYLNILLVGGGLLFSMGMKEILVTESLFKVAIVSSYTIACTVLMGFSVFFSILIESTVSPVLMRQPRMYLDD